MLSTSITLEIDPVRLEDPVVAQAVAAVLLALEGAGAPTSAAAGKAKAKTRSKAKAKAKAAPEAPSSDAYAAFFAQLPETSRRFLTLLEEVGTLTISDAVSRLGLAKPKSLGGITGAISRWAPTRGAKVPFEKLTIEGERAWRWIGA